MIKWNEVSDSERYKSLDLGDQEKVREHYFNTNIAPKVTEDQFDYAWDQFKTRSTDVDKEREIVDHEAAGGGGVGATKKGGLTAMSTAVTMDKIADSIMPLPRAINAAGEALGYDIEGWKDDLRLKALNWVKDKKGDIPNHPTMARALERTKKTYDETEGWTAAPKAMGAFIKEAWDSPDTTGFLTEVAAEQAIPMALTPLTGGAVGKVVTGVGGKVLGSAAGGAVSSMAQTLGSNTIAQLEEGYGIDEASFRAFTRSLAQASVDGLTAGFVPLKIGNQVVNVSVQSAFQVMGGMGGEALAAYTMGEEIKFEELVAEGLLELITMPADVAGAIASSRASKKPYDPNDPSGPNGPNDPDDPNNPPGPNGPGDDAGVLLGLPPEDEPGDNPGGAPPPINLGTNTPDGQTMPTRVIYNQDSLGAIDLFAAGSMIPLTDEQMQAPDAVAPDVEAPVDYTQEGSIDVSEDQPISGPGESRHVDVDPRETQVDAERFQFKEGGDSQGVTDRLKGVEKWDDNLAGVSAVWQDESGQDFVADGHQRFGLANRLMDEGTQDGIKIPSLVWKESDGISDVQARGLAAFKNIAEGSGTALDGAKVLRDVDPNDETMGDMVEALPKSGQLIKDARGLTKLGDNAFQMAVNKIIPEGFASLVGDKVEGDAEQSSIIDLLAKTKPANKRQAEMIIDQANAAGFDTRTEQGGLFGDVEITESLFKERAVVLDGALKKIKGNKRIVTMLVDNDSDISNIGGNQLDTDANKTQMTKDDEIISIVSKLANSKGEVSDALSAAARDIKAGKATSKSISNFIGEVRKHLEGKKKDKKAADVSRKKENKAINKAANETNVSPTESQIQADNYKKGRIAIHGFNIAIETPAGATRSGTDESGKKWSITMPSDAHYGDLKGYRGADGDDMDVFVGDYPDSKEIYVISQHDSNDEFDEHKVMMNYYSRSEAIAAYEGSFEAGKSNARGIQTFQEDEFKVWITNADRIHRNEQQQNESPAEQTDKTDEKSVLIAPKEQKPEETKADSPEKPGKMAGNKLFTEDKVAAARAELIKKLANLNAGLDFETMQLASVVAGGHIESGARKFTAFSKAMISDLGDVIEPYLKSLYSMVYFHPEFDNSGMDALDSLDSADKRVDEKKREEVDSLDEDEKDAEIATLRKLAFTHPLTGLKNYLQYKKDIEENPKKVQVSIDVDGLKAVNDHMGGHEAGDALLIVVADALVNVSEWVYHKSGDEFILQGDTEKDVHETLKKARKLLEEAVIEANLEGEIIYKVGADFTYATGETYEQADSGLAAEKERREKAGLRGSREGKPRGLVRPSYGQRKEKANEHKDNESSNGSAEEKGIKLSDFLYENIKEIKDNNSLKKKYAEHKGIDVKEVTAEQVKDAQEQFEVALVLQARNTVSGESTLESTFSTLLEQYKSQPLLNMRSSTSIENQAYSTPAPIAYLASKLSGIKKGTKVYEPTAGNGMLLIGSDQNSIVNELNDDRASNLEDMGFTVTKNDATKYKPKGMVDAVIQNPPFGKLKNSEGRNESIDEDGYKIESIDHAIVIKSLEAMKDDGKATLIIGAHKVAGAQSNGDRTFFNWLYSNYNVADHFEVDGKLYTRQGAAWPIRVITIEGRNKTESIGPKAGTIKRLTEWSSIYEHVNAVLDARKRGLNEGRIGGTDSGIGPGRGLDTKGNDGRQANGNDGKSGKSGSNVGGGSGNVSGNRDAGQAGSDGKGNGDGGTTIRPDRSGSTKGSNVSSPNKDSGRKSNTGKPDSKPGKEPDVNASDFQVAYPSKSKGKNEDVLIPKNMAESIEIALDRMEKDIGMSVDDYVMSKLGYDSKEELFNAFMGLQVDTIAASIYNNEEKNKAIIIADSTGVGKGRQAAGIIRYAKAIGKTPIFITEKENLFTDMYDDLHDIGESDISPFLLNNNSVIASEKNGNVPKTKKRTEKINSMIETGYLEPENDMLFMTYSQITTDNKQRKLINALKHNAFFVLDESHNISGQRESIVKGVKRIHGAGFMYDVIRDAPVLYLSATYAKRAENMPIYYRTDIMDSVDDSDDLIDSIQRGGLPLQQVIANMLTESGQLFRRERSLKGISIPTVVDVENGDYHRETSDHVNSGLEAIMEADRMFHSGFAKIYIENAKDEGGGAYSAGNKSSSTVNHAGFNSIIHNYIRQFLLTIKVDQAIEKAIASYKKGEKPVLALENTMGSFLADYIKDNDLVVGDEIRASYKDILLKALDGSRVMTHVDVRGKKKKVIIPLDSLDDTTREYYDEAKVKILKAKIPDNLPISPIDYIKYKLSEEGINVGEITGRDYSIDYSGDVPVVSRRNTVERKNKRGTVDKFNNGNLDALVLNSAGATGLSAHASENFKDQNKRHMVVIQPMQDINTLVQMLGRVNRTGQVVVPNYTLMSTDLPAEKRPMSVTAKKLSSLNANTSANDESDTSIEAADIMNKYGDIVVSSYLAEDKALAEKLDMRGNSSAEAAEMPGFALKATGRLAVLPWRQQERFYKDVEKEYNELIEYLNKTGQNDLIAQTLDLDARIIESKVVYQGKDPSSIFGGNTTLHKVNSKYQGKPPRASQVKKELNKKSVLTSDQIIATKDTDTSYLSYLEETSARLSDTHEKFKNTKKGSENYDKMLSSHADALEKAEIRERETKEEIEETKLLIQRYSVGEVFNLTLEEGTQTKGIVVSVNDKHENGKGNPYSRSKVSVRFMVNSGVYSVTLPLTKLGFNSTVSTNAGIYKNPNETLDQRVDGIFSEEATIKRETRYIATGNIINGLAKLPGRIVNFTDDKGKTHQGILTPSSFNEDGDTSTTTDHIIVRDIDVLLKYHKDNRGRYDLSYHESKEVIMGYSGDDFVITVSKAQKYKHARAVKFDSELRDIVGDFYGNGAQMTAIVKPRKIKAAIKRLTEIVTMGLRGTHRGKFEDAGGKPMDEAIESFDSLESENNDPKGISGDTGALFKKDGEKVSGVTKAEVEKYIAKAKYKAPEGIRIHALQSVSELPFDAPSDIKGASFKGDVYIIADQNTSEELKTTLAHELVGHAGIEAVLGRNLEDSLKKIRALKKVKNKRIMAVIERIKKNYLNDETGEYNLEESQEAREIFAHLAERDHKHPIIKSAIAKVRLWLAKHGIGSMDEASLQSIIAKSSRHVVSGGKNPKAPNAQSDKPTFSRKQDSEENKTEKIKKDEGQYLDKAFRYPFSVVKTLDSHGRFKHGVKAYGWTEDLVENKKTGNATVDNILGVFRAGLIDRHGLSDEYVSADAERGAEQRRIALEGEKVVRDMIDRGVSSDEAKLLHDLIEDPDNAFTSERLKGFSTPIIAAIDNYGREMVDLGLISEESYERNRGQYMHRVYKSHEENAGTVSSFILKRMEKRRLSKSDGMLKGRGLTLSVKMGTLAKNVPGWFEQKLSKGKVDETFIGRKFLIFDRLKSVGEGTETIEGVEEGGPEKRRVLERVYLPADQEIPAKYDAWESRGEWEARWTKGNKITLWRDYTKAERKDMGQILDARYTVAKTFMLMSEQIANGRFFKTIAENKEWATHQDPGNAVDPDNKRNSKAGTYAGVDWVKVPNTSISGTGGVKKWGSLAGMYVKGEVWRDLNQLDKVNQHGSWQWLLTQWKLNKTARNPVVHVNNVMSNLIFMDMADIRARDLRNAIKSYLKKSDIYQQAVDDNAFGSSFVNSEIKKEILDPILREITSQNSDDIMSKGGLLGALNTLRKGLLKGELANVAKGSAKVAISAIAKADDKMLNMYQLEDEIFRLATYIRRKELGDSSVEAAAMARRQFLNYDIRAPWVNAARRSFLPFIAYSYRAAPVVAKALAERPWKLPKYFALAYVASMAGYLLNPGDEEEERSVMPEHQSGYTWIGVPRMIRTPFDDNNGDPVYLDIRRWIPVGDIFDTNQHDSGYIPGPMIPGGLLAIGAELYANRQVFTGKDIYDPDMDSVAEKVSSSMKFLYKSMSPNAPWIPYSYSQEKLINAAKGKEDMLGRTYSVPLAVLSVLGIKAAGFNIELQREFRAYGISKNERAIKAALRKAERAYNRKDISKEELMEEQKRLESKMMDVLERAQKMKKKKKK